MLNFLKVLFLQRQCFHSKILNIRKLQLGFTAANFLYNTKSIDVTQIGLMIDIDKEEYGKSTICTRMDQLNIYISLGFLIYLFALDITIRFR